jgi:dTDP-3-amino-3,4,6-trideoxy-alpha-D-glucose transaminase
VLGEEVEAFEREFADACGAKHAIGVGNGTDALALILRATGVGPGDEVIVPAYTAPATWMAVAMLGAEPVGVDVDPDAALIDPDAAAEAIGTRTRAVIAVHLFGRLAPIGAIRERVATRDVLLIEDAAHVPAVDEGHGSAGSLADAAAFSFYPTKTLGGLGDGGAVTTDHDALAEEVRRLRSYGWSEWKGQVERPGVNSRLDELQAAVLRARLSELPRAHVALRKLAATYRQHLRGARGITLPAKPPDADEPPWHQFVVRCQDRDALREALASSGIGTALYYDPLPPQLAAFGRAGSFETAERLARCALSLPLDPWLTEDQLYAVSDAVLEFSGSESRALT